MNTSSLCFDIVAHSFGTYLVANALLDDDTLKVDTVILSGSVLEPDFPWYQILPRNASDAWSTNAGTLISP